MATYIRAAADTAASTIDTAMKWAGDIRKDPDATEQAIRFVGCSALAASAISGVSTPLLSNLSGRLLENADLINCFQLAPSVHYAASGEYSNPKSSVLEKLANATFTSIALGSVSLMLDSWKFIDLTKIAATIGNKVSLLKPITQLGAGVIIRSQLAFAFACLDIYNIKKLVEGNNNQEQKRQLMIDVAQLTSQVAVNTLIVTGAVATSPAVIALGLTAFGLGVVSFVHKIAYKSEIKPRSPRPAIDEGSIPVHTPPKRSGFLHWADFAKRISTSFEGVDFACKFGVGTIGLYGLFAKVTAPFAEANKTLSAMVDLGKFTGLAPRSHGLGGQIAQGKYGFKESVTLVCLTTVSIFESLSWIWGMSDLGKAGSVFKVWRNGFFITGLTSAVLTDSHTIEKLDGKIKDAEARRKKWENKKADTVDELKKYYEAKIDSATSMTDQSKLAKWNTKKAEIEALNDDTAKAEHLVTYRTHLIKKQDDWVGIKEYRTELRDAMKNARVGASTKVVSLAFDLGVICLTVCSVSSVVIPMIGVQFAALARAKQVFTTLNYALGYINLKNFYNREFVVNPLRSYLVDTRGISSRKLA